jgi:DNA-binding transcriptional LysR family regulator
MYNEDGSFSRLRPLKRNPALVLVDTDIIVRAPVRTLVAGMGDALATWFEADACLKSNALNNSGGHITSTAMALARHCLETILECGFNAKKACENKTVTPDFELDNIDLLVSFAMNDFGIACVIRNFVADELESGRLYEIKPTEPIPPRSIGVAWLKDVPLSKASQELIDTLQNQ